MVRLTSVPLKHLQDLPRLQVPDIHLRVFATTYNRLPSGHAETRKQTIRRIGVSLIRLDAFRRLGVP